MKLFSKKNGILIIGILVLIAVSSVYFFRIDLTADKRYSISPQTKKLMKSVTEPMEATVYLTGDLNSGFTRLKKSTVEMLEELSMYSRATINIRFENPAEANSNEGRERNFEKMEQHGMTATSVYEKDKEGKAIQKIIYPWIEVSYKGKKLPVGLLKNIAGLSGEENLNISIENLEFELTDVIRRLTNAETEKIAFIEGHGELSEIETYDISKSLSRYFQIDRGIIGTDPAILNNYRAIIIAKPTQSVPEKDKFVIDQYIMNGGRVLWLVDGVRISDESFSTTGQSPAIDLDLNLNDMLFRYGVRINPVLIEDVQSTLMPMNVAPKGQQPHFEPMPWVFSPLLLTSNESSITRNLPPVKAFFASALEMVGKDIAVKRSFLLASSDNTHIVQTPAEISLADVPDLKDKTYFNAAYIPVAAVLEGEFQSVFANRMTPRELTSVAEIKKTSSPTRQIVVADGDIIRNETEGIGAAAKPLPLGYDRYMNRQFGNNDFITNAVLYLTDKDGWMDLRSKNVALRLLNKNISTTQKTQWQLINVALPLMLLMIFGVIYQWLRKRKYAKLH